MSGGYYIPERFTELRSSALKLWNAVDELLEADSPDDNLWEELKEARDEMEAVLEL